MKKTTIIMIMMLVLCLSLASAISWNRWVPSPTTDNLGIVLSFDNARAFAISKLSNTCFSFDTASWNQINCPRDSLSLSGYSLINHAVGRIGNYGVFVYKNTTTNEIKIIEYDSNTGLYSEKSSFTLNLTDASADSYNPTLVCIQNSGYCISQAKNNGTIYKVYPSLSYVTASKNNAITDTLLYSNQGIISTSGGNGGYEWNNFSWIDRSMPSPSVQHYYVTAQNRYAFGRKTGGQPTPWYCSQLNYSSGLFYTGCASNWSLGTHSNDIGGTPRVFIIGNDIFGIANTGLFPSTGRRTFYVYHSNLNYTEVLATSTNDMNWTDYNVVSGYGWAVGDAGSIYYLLGESTTTFTLTRGISSGVYNGVSNFWVVPTSGNSPVSIQVEIYNRTFGSPIYTWDWSNVPTGYNASNTIEGISWSNFEVGQTYNVIYTLTDSASNVLTFNDSWAVTAQSQGGFNITALTASFTHVCVNQTIFFNINANNSEDNPLTYDFSCDGFKNPLTYSLRYNEFFCSYNTVGNRTVYGYAWDDYSVDNPQSSNIVINVSTCIANYTILGKVYDYDTGLVVRGANVTLDDGQTALSDVNGNVAFFVSDDRLYGVTITKPDYFSKSVYGSVDSVNGWIITRIGGSEGGVRTTLIVNTVAQNGSVIGGSLVSVLEPVSGQSDFGITDALGVYVFVEMMTGDRILVSASNEPKHYEATGDYISLTYGETKEITLTMSDKMRTGVYYGNARMCVDPIKGVLLCGNLSTTGAGSNCLVDADCISDRCMPSKTCSTFNWTVCDIHGLTRGQYCFARSTSEGALSGLTNIIFSFFIFVCVILFIIGIFILVKKRNN